ncbi:hypothetical protein ACP275_13G180500 [Erythranthe tilingii]
MKNNTVVSNSKKKKTMGRRKIEIKKIEKKSSLQVTFTKRRMGLFRKASELSVLCGAEIAILVQSPADKIFSYGHPSVEALVDRLLGHHNGGGAFPSHELAASSSSTTTRSYSLQRQIVPWQEDGRIKYEEALRKLEFEKLSIQKQEIIMSTSMDFWWDKSIDQFTELHELEEFVQALEALKNNVSYKLEEMAKHKLQPDYASSSNNFFDHHNYHGGVFPLQTINHQDFYGGKSEFEILKVKGSAAEDVIRNNAQMEKEGSINIIGGSCSSSDYYNVTNKRSDDDDDAMINYDDLFVDQDPTLDF